MPRRIRLTKEKIRKIREEASSGEYYYGKRKDIADKIGISAIPVDKYAGDILDKQKKEFLESKTKQCRKCNKWKDSRGFNKNKARRNGLGNWCKECMKQYEKQYRQKSKNKERKKQWYQKNKERMFEMSGQWVKEKRKNDLQWRFSRNTSNAIGRFLRKGKGGIHWEEFLGYSWRERTWKYLVENKPNGYTIEKLHVDHIIPISAFRSNINIVRECWKKENLQLLPVSENSSKKNKVLLEFQHLLDKIPDEALKPWAIKKKTCNKLKEHFQPCLAF